MVIRSDTHIDVVFDPGFIRTSMTLWRDSTDMTIPVHDVFKVDFMTNRRTLLAGFERTSAAWAMLLRSMKSATSPAELEKVCSEVDQFGTWARGELANLDALGLENE
ncbi:hypothetical protein [Paraburkholderia megapolitana]|uniref:hypothetical protein n=1 Tax=Paraburkholderia megapolitana TaxID=420953 RepID=UPI0038BDB151